MTSAEDAIRRRQAEQKAAEERRKEDEYLHFKNKLLPIIQAEAKLAIKRLEAKGWPGGELQDFLFEEPTVNWRGKQTGTRRVSKSVACWKLCHDSGERWSETLYLMSDGGLHGSVYHFPHERVLNAIKSLGR